jgi:hypothetical protein
MDPALAADVAANDCVAALAQHAQMTPVKNDRLVRWLWFIVNFPKSGHALKYERGPEWVKRYRGTISPNTAHCLASLLSLGCRLYENHPEENMPTKNN